MSIWGEEIHIKWSVWISEKVGPLTKTLKGTKQTKRDEPHTEERQVKKMWWGKGKTKELIFSTKEDHQWSPVWNSDKAHII